MVETCRGIAVMRKCLILLCFGGCVTPGFWGRYLTMLSCPLILLPGLCEGLNIKGGGWHFSAIGTTNYKIELINCI